MMKQTELCYIPLDVIMEKKRIVSCPFFNGADQGCEHETDAGNCDKSEGDNCPNVFYAML